MGISSLGVGSGILTQSVLDQLRKADESQRITPISLNIANETDKQNSLEVLKASIKNLRDSINELKGATLFDARSATVNSGTSVSVTASSNTDMQDFQVEVVSLAKKQIEQSGIFSAKTDVIDANAGSFDLQVGSGTSAQTVTINYNAGATLDDMKKLINTNAGNLVNASIVQTNTGEFHLFLSSKATGDGNTATNPNDTTNISIKNALGLDARLTTDFDKAPTQLGKDASFKYNGQLLTRSSNTITDLITGLTMNLKEAGVSNVSIVQDRSSIETKVDSFVKQYNAAMTELDKQTKSSVDTATKGIFSGESSIKSMKRRIQEMISSVSNAGGNMQDYGFSTDRNGVLSIDKTVLNAKIDASPTNVEAFFAGGDYTKADKSVVTLTGAFDGFDNLVYGYTKSSGGLDQLNTSITNNITTYKADKVSATERLDAKYAILKKQYTAFNTLINQFNSSSSIFTQLTNSNRRN